MRYTTNANDTVQSQIAYVNVASNTIALSENTWFTFANVANISAVAGSSSININNLSNTYNIINNGNYSVPQYPILDIVKIGDLLKINNNPTMVALSIDYLNNKINLTAPIANTVNSTLTVTRNVYIPTGNVTVFTTFRN